MVESVRDSKGAEMDKARKSQSTRKPPEPAESHGVIDDWMGSQMPDLQPIVKGLDRLIRDTLTDLQYAVKWKKAYYGVPKQGWVIEMVAYDVSVNVVFFGGAEFDQPPPQGDSDRSRYLKVKSWDEVDQAEMKEWIRQAGSVPGWE